MIRKSRCYIVKVKEEGKREYQVGFSYKKSAQRFSRQAHLKNAKIKISKCIKW